MSIFSYLDFKYHYLGMGAIEKMFLLSFQILKLVVILMLKELYARAQNRLNFQILAYLPNLLTIDLLTMALDAYYIDFVNTCYDYTTVKGLLMVKK